MLDPLALAVCALGESVKKDSGKEPFAKRVEGSSLIQIR
jgi:hypothetical protein